MPPQFGSLVPRNRDQTGWTVVCLAKNPKHTGIHIVGWYENATLLGEWRIASEDRTDLSVQSDDPNYGWAYCITSQTTYFVLPEDRTTPFSHPSVRSSKHSFLVGPGVNPTKNKPQVLRILLGRLETLKSVAIRNPTEETAPDPKADSSNPLKVFGTAEHRKRVEKAAEKAVIEHYTKKGFSYTDVTKRNCGFDFIFEKGNKLRNVEVKGTSGTIRRFFLTSNEDAYRQFPTWRLAMVTNALGDAPAVQVYNNHQFTREFELTPYVYIGNQLIESEKF